MRFTQIGLWLSICLMVTTPGVSEERGPVWLRHVIDRSSRGADGVRLTDVNADGLLDVVTGWEEGGQVRVCLHPGTASVTLQWPSVTVGHVRSPEDSVFVDLDDDGQIDVVSCCEGAERTVFAHWAPTHRADYLLADTWKTVAFPATVKQRAWMFCLPMQVDGQQGTDLILGAKHPHAAIGWLEAPRNPRDLSAWKWHSIHEATWIMSLFAEDVDSDGDPDILTTDRKGTASGCYWLENPGPGKRQRQSWKTHLVGGLGQEVMFMTPADLDGDGLSDIVSAVRRDDLLYFRRTQKEPPTWETHSIKMPADVGGGKGVSVGDIDLDGRQDIVFSCEGADNKSGVAWLSARTTVFDPHWQAHEISGRSTGDGIKFDLVELLDLDGDGDLDVMTCEERDNLGVIWYENPAR